MKRILLVITLLTSSIFAGNILHENLDFVINNQPILIEAELQNIEVASVDSVEVYYKGDTDLVFSSAIMDALPPNRYQTNLTPIFNGASNFNYYIVVKMQDNSIFTLPEIYPEENTFVAEIKRSENDPLIKLLNPANKEFIIDSKPVVLISYEDPFEILDLKTVKIMVDGKNVTRKANIFPTMVSYVPKRALKKGAHNIEFSVNDVNGESYNVHSDFTFEPERPSLIKYSGSITSYLDLYSTNKVTSSNTKPANQIKNTVKVKLKAGPVNMKLKYYTNSEEKDYSQRLNRNTLHLYDDKKNIKIDLLDSTPILSEYTLNGVNVEGLNASWKIWPGVLDIKYINGKTKRMINTTISPSSNNTFKQNIDAFQIGLKIAGYKTAFNYVHFKDDMASLPVTTDWKSKKPEENIVMSWMNKLSLFDNKTYIKTELAGSAYYADTSTGDATVPTETREMIPEFLLNAIPLNSTMKVGGAGFFELGTPLLFKELYFKGFGALVMPEYNSFGNTSIKKDDFNYGGTLKVNLLRNALSFSGTYKKSQNNILKLFDETKGSSYTTMGDDYRVMANTNVFGLFNFGYNYSLGLKKTDSVVTASSYMENETKTNMFSFTNIKLEYGKFTGKLNFSLSQIAYTDAASTGNNRNDFEQNGMNFVIDTKYEPVKLKISFSNSDKNNKGVTPSITTYQSYGVRLDYDYIPKILSVYGSVLISTGTNKGSDSSKLQDSSKTTLTVGGIYKLPKKYFLFYDTKLYVNLKMAASADGLDSTGKGDYSEQTLSFKLKTFF